MLIADDSPDADYEAVDIDKYPKVKQFKMPAYAGWFAGRALVISQVTTEYFIWLDDDFELTEETKLEDLFDIIEATGFDIISGQVNDMNMENSKWQDKSYFDIKRNKNGFCYNRCVLIN